MNPQEELVFAIKTAFPCGNAIMVDLFFCDGVPNVGETEIIDYTVPKCKAFVLSEFGYNVYTGPATMEFSVSVSGIPIPNSVTGTTPARIYYPVYQLEKTYKLCNPGQRILMTVRQTAVIGGTFKVWGRLKGWYYV